MSTLNQIKKTILHARSIAVLCHKNPDGDCIGSMLATGLGLACLGKRVYMVSQDGVPRKYANLPGASDVIRDIKQPVDMAITVDSNAKDMLGKPYNIIKASRHILEIDHHEFREPFGNLFLIDTRAAAVGELVYRLLTYLKITITKNIARNILTSIIVETNSFRLPTVQPVTFSICSALLETGIGYHTFAELIYWSKTKQAVLLSALCMARLKFSNTDSLAWSFAKIEDFRNMHGSDEDIDAVATDILLIRTVKIAILFREKSRHKLRVSLRSKGGVNIASLAQQYNGGGHFDCAGCYIANNEHSVQEFLNAAKRLLKRKQ
jgi:bifunctional oligoribonuclease and PAP phosphatase NrnA